MIDFILRKLFSIITINRGYNRLLRENNSTLLYKIKDELTDFEFKNINKKNLILKSLELNFEVIVRQYYLRTLTGFAFNKTILYSIGNNNSKIIYPLPLAWIKILKKNGLNISVILSSLLWFLLNIIFFMNGLLYFLEISTKFLFNIFSKQNLKNYCFFYKLTANNLPDNKELKFDIINWYLKWSLKTNKVKNIVHDYKTNNYSYQNHNIIYSKDLIYKKYTIINYFSFLLNFILLFSYILFNVCLAKIYYLLLFKELIKYIEVKNKSNCYLAKEYFFHSSDWIYRPLWTYLAEKNGSKIYFYFYSANYEKYGSIFNNYWPITSWPIMLIWNKYQENFFKSKIKNKHIKYINCEPIYFSDINKNIIIPQNTIGIFTDQPQRHSIYCWLGLPDNYLTPDTFIKFLDDTNYLVAKYNLNFAHKIKRNIGRSSHPKYLHYVKKLSNNENFIEIEPDISAFKIIKKCKAVISSPFTSTSLIAKFYNIPTIYYDPLNQVKKYEKAAHGIKVVYNIKELEDWLLKCINK